VTTSRNTKGVSIEAILAFVFGVAFCVLLAYAALRDKPITDPGQFFLFRVLAALSAAGVAAMIPGFLLTRLEFKRKISVQAGGAVAVFVLVYFVNPPELVSPHKAEIGGEGDGDVGAQTPIVAALQNGQTDHAIDLVRQLLDKYPHSSRAHYNLAVALTRKAKSDQDNDSRKKLLDKAGDELSKALRDNILTELLVKEQISDPINYVETDPDLLFLLESQPGTKTLIESHKSDLAVLMGTKGYGSGGCFAFRTLISLANGTQKPIESVEIDDELISWDERNSVTTTGRVTGKGTSQQKALLFNNLIRCSETQPFLTRERGWITAQHLRVGDSLITLNSGPVAIRSIAICPEFD
jgi:hypothetical protein